MLVPVRVLVKVSHNVWNPPIELLFLEQISGVLVPFVNEIDLAKIALSCHFGLDSVCYKEVDHDFARRFFGHHCPWSMSITTLEHHCHQTFLVTSRTRQSRPSSIAL